MNTSLPSDLETRVRDAYQAAGRTVHPQTLRRTTPGIAAGPSRRSRRLNALIPVAAAVVVLAVIGASVGDEDLGWHILLPLQKPGISMTEEGRYGKGKIERRATI